MAWNRRRRSILMVNETEKKLLNQSFRREVNGEKRKTNKRLKTHIVSYTQIVRRHCFHWVGCFFPSFNFCKIDRFRLISTRDFENSIHG